MSMTDQMKSWLRLCEFVEDDSQLPLNRAPIVDAALKDILKVSLIPNDIPDFREFDQSMLDELQRAMSDTNKITIDAGTTYEAEVSPWYAICNNVHGDNAVRYGYISEDVSLYLEKNYPNVISWVNEVLT